MSVADLMAILESGAIRQIGTPLEIYDHPTSIYVARLLGSPMMNILPSVSKGGDIAVADGAIPAKYKELIAVAVALTTQCPYCT